MKLLLDVGNTRIKWMLVGGPDLPAAGVALLKNLPDFFSDVVMQVKGVAINAVALSSVAGPKVDEKICTWVQQCFGFAPMVAKVQRQCAGVEVAYAELQNLGVDRWLAMLGAWSKRRSAAIVVDAGSAITVDYIAADGMHEGGVIVPGLNLMRQALFLNTSSVKVPELVLPPRWAPGKDTVPCVANGLAAMVVGFLSEVVGKRPGAVVLLTGGDAEVIQPYFDSAVEHHPQLVLEGLMCVS